MLLKNGADVHVKEAPGFTALIYSKNEAMMSIFLEHGANIHVTHREGRTALHLAAKLGRERIVEILLKTWSKNR